MSKSKENRCVVIFAEERWVDNPSIELGTPYPGERYKAKKRESNRNDDTRQEDNESDKSQCSLLHFLN